MSIIKFTPIEKKILCLASLGGMLEFYDFVIYGIFSAYFASQFFPTHDPLMSVIESYVVFVLGYLARPIGGIFFSHIGDEKGRKQVLIITVVLMGVSSLGIGLLPTYATIGIYAPLLLLLLRLLQGLAIGGELPSTYVYVRESISHKANLSFGIIMSVIVFGLLFGMIINFILTHTLNHQQLVSFGWRIPFFIGGALCLISYKIRQQLHETHAFEAIKNKPEFPILHLLKYHFQALLVGTMITAVLASSIVTFIIFMPTYLLKILKLNPLIVGSDTLYITILTIIIAFYTGYIIEKFKLNVNRVFKILTLLAIVLAGVAFFILYTNSNLVIAMLIFGIIVGMFTALSPAIITTLFPTEVRLTGVALCYNLGFSIFGGLAPIVITSIIRDGGNIYLVPFTYVSIISILGFIAINLCIKRIKI
jgi:MFS family permease